MKKIIVTCGQQEQSFSKTMSVYHWTNPYKVEFSVVFNHIVVESERKIKEKSPFFFIKN